MNLVNLILNFAQFIIYRNYIRECFGSEKHRKHAVYLSGKKFICFALWSGVFFVKVR